MKIANSLHSGRWLLPAMLWLLHAALLVGVESPWVHPLLLTHFGLFLLWQPLWRGERAVGRGAFIFIALAAAAAMFWLNWWVIAFWLTGLFGLVGARVFTFRDRWTPLLYLSVTVYLLAVLLLWVVPNLFAVQSTLEVGRILTWYVLPLLLLVMPVFPVSKEQTESTQTVDFIYSLLLFMLLTLVVLGSLAFMTLGRLDYLDALLRTLFLIGLILLAFGVLWNPRFGFSGLQVMFSRYLLNVGTPFESWLTQLTEAVQREPDAAAYLRRAVALLADFPWLSGLSWQSPGQSPDSTGQLGQFSEHAVVVQEEGLRLTLYARQSLNPTLLLHIHLLVQLIGYFYQAKQREQSLRNITRLQAVYETGSRLTHDLKNMLQSLLSLSAIAQSREERAQQLLQQQLPLLIQRIEMTLLKLQQPHIESDTPQLALKAWWDSVRMRNQHQLIDWRGTDKLPDKNIPAALFDCVIDNLIDNVLSKRQSEPAITLSVEIQSEPLRLTVCDNGDLIPERIAANLLRGIVVSEQGLGIGLYQAARWAGQLGYRLSLISNRAGKVCFELQENNGMKERRNLNL
jgi:signal transduction histidine kinase